MSYKGIRYEGSIVEKPEAIQNGIVGSWPDWYRKVLGLYRTRELAMCGHEHGGIARFRYSDIEGSRSVCGGRGCYANSIEEE
jgi:hypothetical protein